ncbi:MAG: hypothetical protein JWQ34_451 [Mucilaginibacter sp.]|uniref:hypothetical protein n=1 Tax=Mucilaginibacter sp. TaxID=1882438 RepID=UPI002608710E|nr:hypothetical protein [Mucilaginibacter sp.]MDB5002226.1 hypothetical protein [Mucilaginibacter sp.]
MFEKLFMLVKNNAGMAVIDNPVIPVKYHEAVINEASSSIIEVLKGQMESGKLKDMIKYFQFPGIYNNPLITSTVNKFANKLNNYYGIEPVAALQVAKELIPPVMQEIIQQSKNEQDTDFSLGKLLAMLSGNNNMNTLLSQLAVA